MKEISKKSYIAVMCLSVVCLIVIVASVTYAYFSTQLEGEGRTFSLMAGKLDLNITENKINATGLVPIRDTSKDTLAQENEFTISRTDDSTMDACYSLYLVVDEIGVNLKNKWFKYELDYVNTDGSPDTISGTFEGELDNLQVEKREDGTTAVGKALLTNQELNDTTASRTYTLRVWLSYSDTEDQTSLLTGEPETRTFTAHLVASGASGSCNVESAS